MIDNKEKSKEHAQQGMLYLSQDKLQEAIKEFNKAIMLAPDNVTGYRGRGLAFFGLSEFQKALMNFEKALEFEPEDANLYEMRGLCTLQRAMTDFERVLKLQPDNDIAKHYLSLFKEEEPPKALAPNIPIIPSPTTIEPPKESAVDWIKRNMSILDKDENPGNVLPFLALNECRFDVFELFMNEGLKINRKDKDGSTFMHYVASNGNNDAIKWLKSQGADIYAERTESGFTPLVNAVIKNQIESIKCFIGLGYNINYQAEDGRTAMHIAANFNKVECLKCLFELGANINIQDNEEQTPIFGAAGYGHIESVKYLVSIGADLKIVTKPADFTPIFLATQTGKNEIIKYFISIGFDVNTQTKVGISLVFVAAAEGHLETVKFLYEQGAKLDIKTSMGRTAMNMAEQNGHYEIVEWLKGKL